MPAETEHDRLRGSVLSAKHLFTQSTVLLSFYPYEPQSCFSKYDIQNLFRLISQKLLGTFEEYKLIISWNIQILIQLLILLKRQTWLIL